jgi:cobalt/nickel transport protein
MFMKIFCSLTLAGAVFLGAPLAAQAHFGMVIPSKPAVMEIQEAEVTVDVRFWHPFENAGMDLEKPEKFQVFTGGKAVNLMAGLKEGKLRNFKTWTVDYKIERPGLYVFALEPAPYWEPEEDKFIIHYTKAYVNAFGDDAGWNEPVGLKTEIVPLTNPTGLYAGGLFTGRVLVDGQPAPGSEIEAEWHPGQDKMGQAPHEAMVTLSLTADDNGVFSFAAPKSGWWGFAALNEADYKLKQAGQDKDVELGGVVWVYFHEMKEAVPYAGE